MSSLTVTLGGDLATPGTCVLTLFGGGVIGGVLRYWRQLRKVGGWGDSSPHPAR